MTHSLWHHLGDDLPTSWEASERVRVPHRAGVGRGCRAPFPYLPSGSMTTAQATSQKYLRVVSVPGPGAWRPGCSCSRTFTYDPA